MVRAYIKEVLARLLAVLDVEAYQLNPAFPGEKINVGPHWPPEGSPSAPSPLQLSQGE